MGKCIDCKEITPEACDPCDFELPASCISVTIPDCLDIEEDDLQSVLEEFCSFFEDGFTGTVENITSITVVNGIVTNLE